MKKKIKKSSKPEPKITATPLVAEGPERRECPLGQVSLEIGDVVKVHTENCIVDMVNYSRARCLPLTMKTVAYKTSGGNTVEFSTFGRCHSISPCLERNLVLERRGEKGLKEFFASKAPRREIEKEPSGRKGKMGKLKPVIELDGVKLPSNKYDRALWIALYEGGKPAEIAERVAAQFNGVKWAEEWDMHLPKTALKWFDETAADMEKAGVKIELGRPYKPLGGEAAKPEVAKPKEPEPSKPAAKKKKSAKTPDKTPVAKAVAAGAYDNAPAPKVG